MHPEDAKKIIWIREHKERGDCDGCVMNHWFRGCESMFRCAKDVDGWIIYSGILDDEEISILYHRDIPLVDQCGVADGLEEFIGLIFLENEV